MCHKLHKGWRRTVLAGLVELLFGGRETDRQRRERQSQRGRQRGKKRDGEV